jgi:uncharacterized protein YjbI with pentapeptide repeats
VEAWNAWRKANPKIRPDLSHADLHRAELLKADLIGVDLRGTKLEEANLAGADLSGADLGRADLNGANLNRAHLREARLLEAHLEGANLEEANLEGANLEGASLEGTHLSGAYLKGAHLIQADLSRADLSRAYLGADLQQARLCEANLHRAHLKGVNLGGADLERAHLCEANLEGSHLEGARLIRADLSEADLGGARFHEAVIGFTTFTNTNLSHVHGLTTIRHTSPSSIGIDTLYISGGKIPEAFLRGCGVPDSLIEYIPTLIGAMEPIQFYSCFISYSTKDEDFAQRLYSRMRDHHLRVWFAPEDIQSGKKLHEQLEHAIQLHDRLLLVLSEHSIVSEWVTTEIYNARQVELREQRRKLFPIRLCGFETLKAWKCFDADTGKDLAREVREYFIPDFSNWKDHDAFEREFARLLRDLKATEAPPARNGGTTA